MNQIFGCLDQRYKLMTCCHCHRRRRQHHQTRRCCCCYYFHWCYCYRCYYRCRRCCDQVKINLESIDKKGLASIGIGTASAAVIRSAVSAAAEMLTIYCENRTADRILAAIATVIALDVVVVIFVRTLIRIESR